MMGVHKVVCVNTGMLTIRLGVGLVMAVNGWQKFSDAAGAVGFFEDIGIPAIVTYLGDSD